MASKSFGIRPTYPAVTISLLQVIVPPTFRQDGLPHPRYTRVRVHEHVCSGTSPILACDDMSAGADQSVMSPQMQPQDRTRLPDNRSRTDGSVGPSNWLGGIDHVTTFRISPDSIINILFATVQSSPPYDLVWHSTGKSPGRRRRERSARQTRLLGETDDTTGASGTTVKGKITGR